MFVRRLALCYAMKFFVIITLHTHVLQGGDLRDILKSFDENYT